MLSNLLHLESRCRAAENDLLDAQKEVARLTRHRNAKVRELRQLRKDIRADKESEPLFDIAAKVRKSLVICEGCNRTRLFHGDVEEVLSQARAERWGYSEVEEREAWLPCEFCWLFYCPTCRSMERSAGGDKDEFLGGDTA
jgi:hypothetical protein